MGTRFHLVPRYPRYPQMVILFFLVFSLCIFCVLIVINRYRVTKERDPNTGIKRFIRRTLPRTDFGPASPSQPFCRIFPLSAFSSRLITKKLWTLNPGSPVVV
jgi:hypothetical protein